MISKRILKLFLIFSFVLSGSDAFGQELLAKPKCKDADQQLCVAALAEGQKAPFAGQLMTPRMAAEIAVRADQADERVSAAEERVAGIWQAKLDYEKELRRIDVETKDGHIKWWTAEAAALREQINGPFYREPWFVATVSVILTISTIYITGATLGELAPNQGAAE